jgi:hypothetical protein
MDKLNPERDNPGRNDLSAWDDLIRFQVNIAERWLKRGDKAEDIFAKFFFYFTGFNALYFLWRKIDGLDQTNEGKHIENLLKKFDEIKAQEILDGVRTNVAYFCQRRPIQRMDKRTINDPYSGEEYEGRRWKERLQDNQLSALERIVAMGQILYLVRSNLVHGSKAETGDDREIIQMSIEPLRIFLREALLRTRQQRPGGR